MTITHRDLIQLSSAPKPFDAPGWIFELKYDGFRALLHGGGAQRITSRHGNPMGQAFPELLRELEDMADVVMDAELVVVDERGHPQFERLARRARMSRPLEVHAAIERDPAALFVFDLLWCEGKDCRRMPLSERKALLEEVLRGGQRVRYAGHHAVHGERLFKEAEKLELEGIVGKFAASPYAAGRSKHWVKVKTAIGKAREQLRLPRSSGRSVRSV